MKIRFSVDDIRPQKLADGSYKVVLTTGEHESDAMAMLMIAKKGIYNVEIEEDVEKS